MKTVSFLSRFTIICNICFVLFAILGFLQKSDYGNSIPGTVEKIPFIKELIIILGFPAIAINLLMCLSYAVLLFLGKKEWIPKWLAWINVAFFIVEFCYYFFLL